MKEAAVRGREGRMAFKWWHGLILGLLLAYVPGSLLVGGVLLLPLVVLHFVDPDADRQRMMIVLFYLGAVMVHPLRTAWLSHGDWQTCVQQITQPITLILDWMAVGLHGWLLKLRRSGQGCGMLISHAGSAGRSKKGSPPCVTNGLIQGLRTKPETPFGALGVFATLRLTLDKSRRQIACSPANQATGIILRREGA